MGKQYLYKYRLKKTKLFWYRGLATGKTWKEALARVRRKYPKRVQIRRIEATT